jgi:HlyD family secretion protein
MSRRLGALGLLFVAAGLLAACGRDNAGTFQGWIEGDLIFVSPDEQGRIENMNVREGDAVENGRLLFALDSDLQRADLAVAEAAFANAKQAFERAQVLLKSGSGTQSNFEVTQAAAREAEARLIAAQTRVNRRKGLSPVSGIVQQVYYRPGETVQPAKPIVALLPPGNIKVRFFVPEPLLARIAIGDKLHVTCDGCASDLAAAITFIARSAEFTPPVIYSLEERSKLVFLVEARPERPESLRVGQPVSVTVMPRERPR